MASENKALDNAIPLPSSTDLSDSQYCAVRTNGSGQIALCGTDEPGIGILQDKPEAAGRPGLVAFAGASKARAGAEIVLSSTGVTPVSPDSTGRLVPSGTSAPVFGYALTAAAAADDIFTVLINPQYEPIS